MPLYFLKGLQPCLLELIFKTVVYQLVELIRLKKNSQLLLLSFIEKNMCDTYIESAAVKDAFLGHSSIGLHHLEV